MLKTKSVCKDIYSSENEGEKLRELFADVYVLCGEEVIKAHRLVLSMVSPFFCQKLVSNFDNNTVALVQCDLLNLPALKSLIGFCYGDDVMVTKENVVHLLSVAKHLQLEDVFKECLDRLIGFITLDMKTLPTDWSVTLGKYFNLVCNDERLLKLPGACICDILMSTNVTTNNNALASLHFLQLYHQRLMKSLPVGPESAIQTAIDTFGCLPKNQFEQKMVCKAIINKAIHFDKLTSVYLAKMLVHQSEMKLHSTLLETNKTESTKLMEVDGSMQITDEADCLLFNSSLSVLPLIDSFLLTQALHKQKNEKVVSYPTKTKVALSVHRHYKVRCFVIGGCPGDDLMHVEPLTCFSVASDYQCKSDNSLHLRRVPLTFNEIMYPLSWATGVAMSNGSICLAGGLTSAGLSSKRVQIYSPVADRWTLASNMSVDRNGHGLCVKQNNDNVIVAIGGDLVSLARKSAEQFDIRANNWIAMPGCLNDVHSVTKAVSIGDEIFVVGGMGVNTVERFDCIANKWRVMPPLLQRRGQHSVLVYKDEIYALGNCFMDQVSTCEKYTPATDTWSVVAELPFGWCGGGVVLLDDEVHCFGGYLDKTGKGQPDHMEHSFTVNLTSGVIANKALAQPFIRHCFAAVQVTV